MWRMDEGKRGEVAVRQGSGRCVVTGPMARATSASSASRPAITLLRSTRRPASPAPNFGRNGIIDLKTDIDQPEVDLITGSIGINSPPAVGNNVVVVGAAHLAGSVPRTKENVKGYVRGYDVRTGKRLWIFHTVPQPGEFGNGMWEKDLWFVHGKHLQLGTDHDR